MGNVLAFSETRCLPYCPVSRTLGEDNQVALRLATGVTRCPGLWRDTTQPEGEGYGCSLPGEALEALAERHPGIPGPMLYEAVAGIVNGEVTATELPPPAPYSPEAVERWGKLILRLDYLRYPGDRYDIAEILI